MRFSLAFLIDCVGSDADQEGVEVRGDAKVVKHELGRGEDASGGSVCWILGAQDIPCVYEAAMVL